MDWIEDNCYHFTHLKDCHSQYDFFFKFNFIMSSRENLLIILPNIHYHPIPLAAQKYLECILIFWLICWSLRAALSRLRRSVALNYKMGDASLSIFGSISLNGREIIIVLRHLLLLHYLILINLVKTDEDGSESWLLGKLHHQSSDKSWVQKCCHKWGGW